MTLDIYAISRRRDRETIERFIARWVDRDGHVVFGISIPDCETDDTLSAAKRILQALVADSGADRGYIGWELPPPLLTPTDFGGGASRIQYEWDRADE